MIWVLTILFLSFIIWLLYPSGEGSISRDFITMKYRCDIFIFMPAFKESIHRIFKIMPYFRNVYHVITELNATESTSFVMAAGNCYYPS